MDAGRHDETSVEPPRRVTEDVDGASVVFRGGGNQTRELRCPPPEGGRRMHLAHANLHRAMLRAKARVNCACNVLEVIEGRQVSETEHPRSKVDAAGRAARGRDGRDGRRR